MQKNNQERERDLGRNLVPWQEEVVGNDPTGRNARRAAGDGDPSRFSGAVLGQERERRCGEKELNGYGGVETPLPALNPHTLATAW